MKLSTLFLLMEGREDVLFAKYEQNIEQQLAHNGEKIEARSAFDQLFRAVGPKVADWAIRQYLKGQFRIEDATRVNTDILQYQKLSRHLPVEERDVNKFDYHYIVNKLDELNKPEISTDAPDEDGVKVMYKGPYGFLCEILTKEAAMRLGKGTKWCTAAEKDNQFDEYHTEGPLFFFQNTRGYKFQFHFEIGQLMTRKNEQLTIEQLNEMIKDNPVIRKLLVVNIHRMIERSSPPIPTEWERLTKKDPLAVIIQDALNKYVTRIHVSRVEQIKNTCPFLQIEDERMYTYLHEHDEFFVKLLNMSPDKQFDFLKNIESDAVLRKRVVDGLKFNPEGKDTQLQLETTEKGYQFFSNILKIMSPSFLRDLTKLKDTKAPLYQARRSIRDFLLQTIKGTNDWGVDITPEQYVYGLFVGEALFDDIIGLMAQLVATSGAKIELINAKCKALFLKTCDPSFKNLLQVRLSGDPLNRSSFEMLLKQAKSGTISPNIVSAYHQLQMVNQLVGEFAEEYARHHYTATDAEIELLYPSAMMVTFKEIHSTVLEGEGVIPVCASWLTEAKSSSFKDQLMTAFAYVIHRTKDRFERLVVEQLATADELINELKYYCSENSLAWYLETDTWSQFVEGLRNTQAGREQ